MTGWGWWRVERFGRRGARGAAGLRSTTCLTALGLVQSRVVFRQRDRQSWLVYTPEAFFLFGGGKSIGVQRTTSGEGLGIEHHYSP